jgi:hypothetical protein
MSEFGRTAVWKRLGVDQHEHVVGIVLGLAGNED